MYQNPKPSNGIVLSYSCPANEAELLKQLLAENELLVSHDLDVARDRKSLVSPVEFAPERSGVVDSGYHILLERPKRIA